VEKYGLLGVTVEDKAKDGFLVSFSIGMLCVCHLMEAGKRSVVERMDVEVGV
jgi:hypothetical protein